VYDLESLQFEGAPVLQRPGVVYDLESLQFELAQVLPVQVVPQDHLSRKRWR
jgi:hypothetical protein